MIEKLKAEIFDIIHEQELMRLKYAELEKVKQAKLKELDKEMGNGDQLPSKS